MIYSLNVEKRRIYDVVNILEAFQVIYRLEKNIYLWCGIDSITKAVKKYEKGKPIETS